MFMTYSTFTSESVCYGHPDKICDQISDAILDAALNEDKNSRVAVETMVTKNFVALAGEVTTKAKLNYKEIARGVIKRLGYDDIKLGFTYKSSMTIKINIKPQEIPIAAVNLAAG